MCNYSNSDNEEKLDDSRSKYFNVNEWGYIRIYELN